MGNFIFTLNLREIEKFMLAMHFRYLAYMKMNDHYIKGIEEINIRDLSYRNLKKIIFLKFVIKLKDLLCFLRISQSSLISIVLFKDKPNKEKIKSLRTQNWVIKKLPKNPYLK